MTIPNPGAPIPPAPAPPINRSGGAKRGINRVFSIIGIVAAICYLIYAFYPVHKVKFGPEEVIYKGDATKDEATALGKALQDRGYFDGKTPETVTLEKSKDDGTVITFTVAAGSESKPSTVEFFACIVHRVAPSVGGAPLTYRMADPEGKELFKDSIANNGIAKVDNIDVICEGSATDAEALALAKALKKANYADAKTEVAVFLDKSKDKQATIKFIVAKPEYAKDPESVKEWENDARTVAPSVGGLPVTLKLIDGEFNELKSEKVQ